MSDCNENVWIINQYAASPSYGVAGRHYYIGRELVNLGCRVRVFSSANTHLLRSLPVVKEEFLVETLEGLRFCWIKMPSYSHAHSKMRIRNWFLFPLRFVSAAGKLHDKPDVILYSSPSLIGFLGAEWLAKRYGCRLVFEVRDIWPLTFCEIGGYSKTNPFIRFLQWIEDRAYRKADSVVSNLKNSVDHMVSRGMDKGKFTWIPNGYLQEEVDTPAILASEIQEKIPRDKFVVGYAGTFGVANSLYHFLDAAKLCDSSKVEFVLAGGGKEKDSLVKYAEENGIENVTFLGVVPKLQVQSLLQNFDACYIGLSNDPLFRFGVSPNKLFDYFSASKPIIYAIDSGEYKPVEDAEAGFHVPPEDAGAIARVVEELMGLSDENRIKMGRKGRVFAEKNHEYKTLAKVMYSSLLGHRND